MTVPRLHWELNVTCPECDENNDLARFEHNDAHDISANIFGDKWENLEGIEVTCEHCGHIFALEKIEY